MAETGQLAQGGPVERPGAMIDVPMALWSRRWLIAVLALVGAVFGWIGGALSVPSHVADASLLYRFDREYLGDDSAFDRWRGEGLRIDPDTAVHTDLEILGSQRLIGMVLDRMGPAPEPELPALRVWLEGFLPDDDDVLEMNDLAASAASGGTERRRALDAFRRDLSIRRVTGTNVVNVTYRHPVPERAVATLETLVELYLVERRALLDRRSGAALAKSLDAAKAALAAAEAERGAFVAAQGLESLSARLGQLQSEREALEFAIAAGTADAGASDRLAGMERDIDRLLSDRRKLEELERVVVLRRDEVERVERLLFQQRLSEEVLRESASPVFVLDAPSLRAEATGLSMSNRVALGAIAGALAGAILALGLAWWRRRDGGLPVQAEA